MTLPIPVIIFIYHWVKYNKIIHNFNDKRNKSLLIFLTKRLIKIFDNSFLKKFFLNFINTYGPDDLFETFDIVSSEIRKVKFFIKFKRSNEGINQIKEKVVSNAEKIGKLSYDFTCSFIDIKENFIRNLREIKNKINNQSQFFLFIDENFSFHVPGYNIFATGSIPKKDSRLFDVLKDFLYNKIEESFYGKKIYHFIVRCFSLYFLIWWNKFEKKREFFNNFQSFFDIGFFVIHLSLSSSFTGFFPERRDFINEYGNTLGNSFKMHEVLYSTIDETIIPDIRSNTEKVREKLENVLTFLLTNPPNLEEESMKIFSDNIKIIMYTYLAVPLKLESFSKVIISIENRLEKMFRNDTHTKMDVDKKKFSHPMILEQENKKKFCERLLKPFLIN